MQFILSNYVNPTLVRLKGSACNASYLYTDTDKLLLSRKTNYSFLENGAGVTGWPFQNNYVTSEILYKKHDEEWLPFKVISEPTIAEQQRYKFCGDEDFRIAKWNNETYVSYSFTRCELKDIVANKHNIPIAISKLTPNLDMTDTKTVLTTCNVEKNWQPILSDEYAFKYVYSYKPFTVIDTTNSVITKVHEQFTENYRGSSQLIKWNDGFLTLVHKRTEPQTTYDHYFVEFDSKLNVKRISEPFKFIGNNVEYSTYIGLIDSHLEILMSANDQIVYEFDVPLQTVEAILNKELHDAHVDKHAMYVKLFNDAELNQNFLAMMCIATFIKQRSYSVEALHCSKYFSALTPNDRFYIQNRLISTI